MERNKIFTFTDPNGVEMIAVVVNLLSWEPDGEYYDTPYGTYTWLCYTQNKLFTYKETVSPEKVTPIDKPHFHFIASGERHICRYSRIIANNCILPDYDAKLEDYYHHIDMANDYSDREL